MKLKATLLRTILLLCLLVPLTSALPASPAVGVEQSSRQQNRLVERSWQYLKPRGTPLPFFSHGEPALHQLLDRPYPWREAPIPRLEALQQPLRIVPHELRFLSPEPGDWVVTGEEVHRDETIILTGNLIVEGTGNLTLIHCTLLMNCSYDNQFSIIVRDGGILNVLQGCNITTYDPTYLYLFTVYGTLRVEDSFISRCCYGIYLDSTEDILFENTTINDNFGQGICCFGSSNITVVNCTICNNGWAGIELWFSSNVSIANCTISSNKASMGMWYFPYGYGIGCWFCSNISMINCGLANNTGFGVLLGYSTSATIRKCTFLRDGIFIDGFFPSDFTSHTIENNMVNGKPLYYVVSTTGYTVPSDAGQVLIFNSTDIQIVGSNLSYTDVGVEIALSSSIYVNSTIFSSNDWVGVYCEYSNNITLANCTIRNAIYGIFWDYSTNVTTTNCTLYNNINGVLTWFSTNITIAYCMFDNSTGGGLLLEYSEYAVVCNCTFARDGVVLWGDALSHYASHTIENNTVNGNPLYYIVNVTSYTVPSDAGQVLLVNSTGILIANLNLSYTDIGLQIAFSSNINIDNIIATDDDFDTIDCFNSTDIIVANCRISRNVWLGVYFGYSTNVVLDSCTVSRVGSIERGRPEYGVSVGVDCYESANVTLTKCQFYNNTGSGVVINRSNRTTVRDCTFTRDGILLRGYKLSHYASHTIENNTVNGNPLYYIVNVSGYVVPPTSGQVIVVNSINIQVVDSGFVETDVGVEVAFSSNITIQRVILSSNDVFGVYCSSSTNVTLTGCTVYSNNVSGVYCDGSSYVSLTNCTIRNNALSTPYWYAFAGIYCYQSSGVEVHYCNIFSNRGYGLYNDGPTVNASYCWWGSSNGPEYRMESEPSDPEEIYGDIVYKPWLQRPWPGVDTTPPSVTITYPADGAILSTSTVQITWTGSDDTGIDHYEVRLYNATWDSGWIDVDGSTNYTFTGLSDGSTYTANVTAYDYAGNVGWDAIIFTIQLQRQPPSIRITYPDNNTYLATRHVTATWQGSDDTGIDHYEVRLYNATWDSGWINIGLQTRYEFTGLSEAEYWLEVNATDLDGLWTIVKHRFWIDLTPPTIQIVNPANNSQLNTTTVEAIWTASDNYGIDHYEVRLYNTTWDSGWIDTGTATSYTFSKLSNSTYTLLVVAYDYAGNTAQTTAVFTVALPSVKPAAPPPPAAPTRWPLFLVIALAVIAAAIGILLWRKRQRSLVEAAEESAP